MKSGAPAPILSAVQKFEMQGVFIYFHERKHKINAEVHLFTLREPTYPLVITRFVI